MAKRRRNHEGSIYKRSNGTWGAQVSIDGKRLSYTGQSQRECREWIRQTQQQINAGLIYEAPRLTYAGYLAIWLATTKATLSPETRRQYRQIIRTYISPEIGRIKLVMLQPSQIQRLYDRLIQAGKGRRTVQLVHAVIHSSLGKAVWLELLRYNPADAATPPKPEKKEITILDQAQVRKL